MKTIAIYASFFLLLIYTAPNVAQLAPFGPCPECNFIYKPVCFNGRTFPNDCVALCTPGSNVGGDLYPVGGICPDKASLVCTKEWNPVCGVDRSTYGNECEATVFDVAIASPGECPETPNPISCQCPPLTMSPVCGADGKTYANECGAKCTGTTVASDGACPQ